MANNSVTIGQDGIILVEEDGFQTKDDIGQLIEKTTDAVKAVQTSNNQVLILVDLTKVTGHDKDAEKEALKVLRLPFDAISLYTKSKVLKLTINTMTTFYYNRDNVRVFNSKTEARRWLLGSEPRTVEAVA